MKQLPGLESLRLAHAAVERAYSLLTSPSVESLEYCSAVLSTVCTDLSNRSAWAASLHGSPEAMSEACRLQDSVRRVSWLHEISREHFAQWSRTVATLGCGYTPAGDPAPLQRSSGSWTG